MKIFVNGERKKLNVSNLELKKPSDIVGDVNFSIALEILKFVIVVLLTIGFVMLQYQNLLNKTAVPGSNILRKIYLYSFGLAFGDLMILILIGVYLSMFVNWSGYFLKNHYFRWFKNYTRVDYWILRNRIMIFVWLMLLSFALIYHSVLVAQRVSNVFYYTPGELANIYTKGWFYSFTNQQELIANPGAVIKYPNASQNVGIFFDSIANLLHIIAFSPFLVWVLICLILTFAWFKLITLKPLKYFKFLNTRKKVLPVIEKYLQRPNSIFYWTTDVKTILNFYREAAKVLKIDIYHFSFHLLEKQVKKNIALLASHPNTSKYFVSIKKKKSYQKIEEEKFLSIVDSMSNYAADATVLMPAVDASFITIKIKNKNFINDYQTSEASNEYTNDFSINISLLELNNNSYNEPANAEFSESFQENEQEEKNYQTVETTEKVENTTADKVQIEDSFEEQIITNPKVPAIKIEEADNSNQINITMTNEIVEEKPIEQIATKHTPGFAIDTADLELNSINEEDLLDINEEKHETTKDNFYVTEETQEVSAINEEKTLTKNETILDGKTAENILTKEMDNENIPRKSNFEFAFNTATLDLTIEDEIKNQASKQTKALEQTEEQDWVSPILSDDI